jgi:hypothetical protein
MAMWMRQTLMMFRLAAERTAASALLHLPLLLPSMVPRP